MSKGLFTIILFWLIWLSGFLLHYILEYMNPESLYFRGICWFVIHYSLIGYTAFKVDNWYYLIFKEKK